MKRRSFLQLLGLSPAVAAMPAAAEEFARKAKALDLPKVEEVPLHTSTKLAGGDDLTMVSCYTYFTMSCGYGFVQRGPHSSEKP